MSELLKTVIEAAQKGGSIVEKYYSTSLEQEIKEDKTFVTIADKEAEAAIIEIIKSKFPDHAILGEEGGEEKGTAEYQWIIDPLDGTANFLMNLPYFAVSIGVLKNGALIAGAVYAPALRAMLAGEKGSGVTLNGAPISVSNRASDKGTVTFGPGQKEKERLNIFMSNSEKFFKSKRYFGACSMDLFYLARGGTDAFVCIGLNPWDFAGGVFLCEEAGATITTFDGKPWKFGDSPYFLVSNGVTHEKLLALAKAST